MATRSIGHSTHKPLSYMECDWGDCVIGSKTQLQSLGLGVGLAFPGEPGGPKRVLSVVDPRGFSARIRRDYVELGIYCASIPFPGRSTPVIGWEPVAPGVRRQCSWVSDHFVGTADALVDAGLVRADQFPGLPGMRKVRVTILPDGTLPTGAPTANFPKGPGTRTVEREGVRTFRVTVLVDAGTSERRAATLRAERDQWERQMRALPRPPRLQPIGAGTVQRWSAPPAITPPRAAPLFELNPAEAKAKEAFAQHAMKTLRELVDFSQESVYGE